MPNKYTKLNISVELVQMTEPCLNGHLGFRYKTSKTCVECHKAHNERRLINRDKEKDREYRAKNKIKIRCRKYGIKVKDYEKMLLNQNNSCSICKASFLNQSDVSIDHCKDDLVVRGLLCSKCNFGIGNFNHNSDILKEAAAYCENPPNAIVMNMGFHIKEVRANSKLTAEDINTIKFADLSLSELAKIYDISPATVSRIKSGQTHAKISSIG